jgi:hypothetical protein
MADMDMSETGMHKGAIGCSWLRQIPIDWSAVVVARSAMT